MARHTSFDYTQDNDDLHDEETAARNRAWYKRHAAKLAAKVAANPLRTGERFSTQSGRVTCTCGARHKPGSPGHVTHMAQYPNLCRKRAGI